VHDPEPLQLAPARIATMTGESGTRGHATFGSSKGSGKHALYKTRWNTGQFYAVLSKNFLPI